MAKKDHGESKQGPEVRKSLILEILEEERKLRVATLAKRLAVTEATLRRDLTDLVAQGHVIRGHGVVELTKSARPWSAQPAQPQPTSLILGFTNGISELIGAKRFLFCGAGSILTESVKSLKNKDILTNSLGIALAAGHSNRIDVIGERLDSESQTLSVRDWTSSFKNRTIEIALIEAEGFDEDYLYVSEANSWLLNEVFARSRFTILVGSNAKFGKTNALGLPYGKDIHYVVTDISNLRERVDGRDCWKDINIKTVDLIPIPIPRNHDHRGADSVEGLRGTGGSTENTLPGRPKVLHSITVDMGEQEMPENASISSKILIPKESRWTEPKQPT